MTENTQTFQPQLTERQTSDYITHFNLYPHYYDDEKKDLIKQHSQYYSLPFYEPHDGGILGI